MPCAQLHLKVPGADQAHSCGSAGPPAPQGAISHGFLHHKRPRSEPTQLQAGAGLLFFFSPLNSPTSSSVFYNCSKISRGKLWNTLRRIEIAAAFPKAISKQETK